MSADRCCMIIDAQPVVRLGMRRVLEKGWEFEELADGRGAIEVLTSVGRIEVAIVEMLSAERGAPSGPATIRSLLHYQPGLGVIGYGGRIERRAMAEALEAGASAYVGKRSPPATMLKAVDAVADFKSFVDPEVERSGTGQVPITPRQRQVLQLFANGHSTDDAAKRLGLSTETVRTHAKASLPRLGARDRAHAIAIAIRGAFIE